MPIIGTPHTHHTHSLPLARLHQFRLQLESVEARQTTDDRRPNAVWLKKQTQTIKRIQNAYFKIHLSFCDRRTNIERGWWWLYWQGRIFLYFSFSFLRGWASSFMAKPKANKSSVFAKTISIKKYPFHKSGYTASMNPLVSFKASGAILSILSGRSPSLHLRSRDY